MSMHAIVVAYDISQIDRSVWTAVRQLRGCPLHSKACIMSFGYMIECDKSNDARVRKSLQVSIFSLKVVDNFFDVRSIGIVEDLQSDFLPSSE